MLIVTLKENDLMFVVRGDNVNVEMFDGIPMLQIYEEYNLILCIHALDLKNVKDAENNIIFEAIRIG